MPSKPLLEPWYSFLADVDAHASEPVELECIGGFVVTALHGFARPTADVDVLSIAPGNQREWILRIAGKGSALHEKHGLYIEYVTVASVPENYEDRLLEIFPDTFSRLRLLALDPYDIALSKLERNNQRDREDVKFLAEKVPLDLKILKERYLRELRPNLGNPAREDLTIQLWIEAIEELRAKHQL